MKPDLDVVIYAVVTSLAEVGSAPSGHIYAALMQHNVGLSLYNKLVDVLVKSGHITQKNHELTITEKGREFSAKLQEAVKG